LGYRLLIDPLLASTRKNIAALINPDVEILDLGCGTGELVFELSHKVKKAVGLDIDENMIKYAQLKKERLALENIEFINKDINDRSILTKNKFDFIVLSMFLHQLKKKEADEIISLIKNMTKNIIFADYMSPLPKTIAGKGAKIIERIAGAEHSKNFRDYQHLGGLSYYLKFHQLNPVFKNITGLGLIKIVNCSL